MEICSTVDMLMYFKETILCFLNAFLQCHQKFPKKNLSNKFVHIQYCSIVGPTTAVPVNVAIRESK